MFKQCDRETICLFPPSVQEWLPEGHVARFVAEIVEQLNLEQLIAKAKAEIERRAAERYAAESEV